MNVYRLGNPYALIFFVLPIACLIVFILSRFIYKKGVKISGVSNFERGFSILPYGYYFSTAMIIAGLFVITFSLTKPQHGMKREKIVSNGIDIMVALDISGSMTQPASKKMSRIESAKAIITKFIEKRAGDRVGLVVFAESSFLKCPGTLNYDLLKDIIAKIHIDPHKQSSTAIGIGLASGINRLLNLKDNDKVESKIVILVTDGRNNAGEITPHTASEIAMKSGIKIYTVGIGQEEQIDIELLENISEKTGGNFFHAQGSKELSDAFEAINSIEKRKIETIEYTRFKNRGYEFATLGVILLLLGILFNSVFFRRLG